MFVLLFLLSLVSLRQESSTGDEVQVEGNDMNSLSLVECHLNASGFLIVNGTGNASCLLDLNNTDAVTDLFVQKEVTFIPDYACSGWRNLRTAVFQSGFAGISLGIGAFQGCTKLWNVSLPRYLLYVNTSLFRNCTSLRAVGSPMLYCTQVKNYSFFGCVELQTFNTALQAVGEYAFAKSGLTSINLLSSSTTNIYAHAFENCVNLTLVNFSGQSRWDVMIYVEKYAFYGCVRLEELNYSIKSSFTPIKFHMNISDYAFANSGLTEFIFANVSIGVGAFQNCSSLTNVTVARALIGDYSFSGCLSLTVFSSKDPVTVVGTSSFYGCKSLRNFNFARVAVVNQLAFAESGLTSFTTSSWIRQVGDSAFENCTFLESVSAENLTKGEHLELGERVFSGCSALVTATFLWGISQIRERTFYGCENLESFFIRFELFSVAEFAFAESGIEQLILPGTVQSIDSHAFENCLHLKSVFFEVHTGNDGVQFGVEVFQGCVQLNTVVLSEGTTEITESMFRNCANLETIHLPSSISIIGKTCFASSGIVWISLPKEISIRESAFQDCKRLTSVMFDGPNTVVALGQSVFEGCMYLSEVLLSEGITDIPSRTFFGCTHLRQLEFPRSVSSLGESSFAHCGLVNISFASGISVIDSHAFHNCTELVLVNFNQSEVVNLGLYTFSGCVSLRTVNLPSGLVTIPAGTFYGCSSLSAISLVAVTAISQYAFLATGLREVRLSDNLRQVGAGCFGYALLESISIADSPSLTFFAEDAFVGCRSLNRIHLRGPSFNRVICDAINFTGFPRSKDVVIEVDYPVASVCGRKPVVVVPTSTPGVSSATSPSVSRTRSASPTASGYPTPSSSPARSPSPTTSQTPTRSQLPTVTVTGAHAKKAAVNWVILGVSVGFLSIGAILLIVTLVSRRRSKSRSTILSKKPDPESLLSVNDVKQDGLKDPHFGCDKCLHFPHLSFGFPESFIEVG
jgi:hypothetical protein